MIWRRNKAGFSAIFWPMLSKDVVPLRKRSNSLKHHHRSFRHPNLCRSSSHEVRQLNVPAQEGFCRTKKPSSPASKFRNSSCITASIRRQPQRRLAIFCGSELQLAGLLVALASLRADDARLQSEAHYQHHGGGSAPRSNQGLSESAPSPIGNSPSSKDRERLFHTASTHCGHSSQTGEHLGLLCHVPQRLNFVGAAAQRRAN